MTPEAASWALAPAFLRNAPKKFCKINNLKCKSPADGAVPESGGHNSRLFTTQVPFARLKAPRQVEQRQAGNRSERYE